jgi:hypothetical protein
MTTELKTELTKSEKDAILKRFHERYLQSQSNIELNDRPQVQKAIDAVIPPIPPRTEAAIHLVEGEQGGGKTCTVVARLIGAYDRRGAEIFLAKKGIKYHGKVKSYDRKTRIIRLSDNGHDRYIRVPKEYKWVSDVKIICNFHLFGVKYLYMPFDKMFQHLNDDLLLHSYLVIDQAEIIASGRESMTTAGRALYKFGQQIRRLDIEYYLIYTHGRMADWTTKLNWTEHIVASYDKITKMITLMIRKKGDKGKAPKEVSFYEPQYRKFYHSDERIKLPEKDLLKAAADTYAGVEDED